MDLKLRGRGAFITGGSMGIAWRNESLKPSPMTWLAVRKSGTGSAMSRALEMTREDFTQEVPIKEE